MNDEFDETDADDGLFSCWCGATGTFDELFDLEGLPDDGRCGGVGTLFCECGGDNLCVCHFHGQTECDGCEDCRDDWNDDSC